LYGRIDLFVSNAGIAILGGEDLPQEKWHLTYDVNVMAHVYAAKYVIPYMKAKGSGYLLNVASAAGLLFESNSAPYTATKHAAVGFAEWLAVEHAKDGIKVSVLCPAWVKTPMAEKALNVEQAIEPDELVEITLKALAKEEFMILTHDYILKLFQLKAADYQKYITMRQDKVKAEIETADHQ
jgi:NAD(P)-dependent dehydrogenase (short-subunit alcohol dehydrogenase family)